MQAHTYLNNAIYLDLGRGFINNSKIGISSSFSGTFLRPSYCSSLSFDYEMEE